MNTNQTKILVMPVGLHVRISDGNGPHLVSLGLQMRNIGSGLYTGTGGKPKEGESIRACLKREAYEEVGVRVEISTMKLVAHVTCYNMDAMIPIVELWVYTYTSPDEPQPSDEKRPSWFEFGKLPPNIPKGDETWLNKALWGTLMQGHVVYTDSTLTECVETCVTPASALYPPSP